MSRPPLHALQGFVAAARLGNLTHAATAMHLTVSALSHQMRTLEERLGRTLLARSPRGIQLTPDGEQLYARVAPHLEAIEHALRPYAARRDQVLVLSLLPSLANSWLMPRLPSFLAAHPQIELSLRSESELVDFERDREVDAALRFGPGQWSGLHAVPLFHEWLTPVASPALLARLGASLDTPLSALPLLGDPGDRWPRWFARFGGKEPKRYVAGFSDSESLHRAASEGLGVALGRMTLARPLLDSGRLVALCADRMPSDFKHCLVWPPRSAGHGAVTSFRDWLLAQAQAWRESEGLPDGVE